MNFRHVQRKYLEAAEINAASKVEFNQGQCALIMQSSST